MEYLSNKIHEKAWTPFSFKNKEPKISHLIFADDVILFNKANIKNIQVIQDILNQFTNVSGMEINTLKSKVWFSKQLSQQTIQNFQSIFDIRQSADLGTYLGYPLKHIYMKNDFKFILDKINRKLQGWKANMLSKIGRMQLINSTLANTSNHLVNAFLLPKSILTEIDRKARNFFWGHDSNTKEIHTIKWEQIVRPKKLEGLRIRTSEYQNTTCFLKLIRKAQHSPDRLWSKVLKKKYGPGILKQKITKSTTFNILQNTYPLY